MIHLGLCLQFVDRTMVAVKAILQVHVLIYKALYDKSYMGSKTTMTSGDIYFHFEFFAPSPFRTGLRSHCKWNQACPFTWSHSCFRPQIWFIIQGLVYKYLQYSFNAPSSFITCQCFIWSAWVCVSSSLIVQWWLLMRLQASLPVNVSYDPLGFVSPVRGSYNGGC